MSSLPSCPFNLLTLSYVLTCHVEISAYLFRVGCIKGSQPLSIAFGRDSGQAEREGSRYALIGLLAMGKLGERQLCDWFGQHSCLFLIGPELEVDAHLEKLAVIDSSLTIPR